jgi:long-chain acyl-CoA synthetase
MPTGPTEDPRAGAVDVKPRQASPHKPGKPALISGPLGRAMSFAALDAEANRAARAMVGLGLVPGDCVAVCLPSTPTMVVAILAAQRVGLYYTLIPTKAVETDVDYIALDSQSKLLLIAEDAPACGALCAVLHPYRIVRASAQPDDGPGPWEQLLMQQSQEPPEHLLPGMEMIYSSGTTGKPKGVRKPLPARAWDSPDPRNVDAARGAGLDASSVYLSTSPLYHSAPHRYLCAALHAGATVVLMERFDAAASLDLLERHACTHSLWVPTMFHRLLRLDEATRKAYIGQHHRLAIHGAAPCPEHVKRAMIAWWGPILVEYYSGTEGIGRTLITSAEWLSHPGSVGRPRDCRVHILSDDGSEVPTGETGTVFFESDQVFTYWGDAQKTDAVTSRQGWRTFGDIGHVDTEGYLYLSDRRGFMVISGGVNIYPQEIESMLTAHPDVVDAAVFGVPDEDLGEKLVAIVQLAESVPQDEAQVGALQTHCRRLGGGIKTPKVIEFRPNFPREENGKILKHRLRQAYIDAEKAAPRSDLR